MLTWVFAITLYVCPWDFFGRRRLDGSSALSKGRFVPQLNGLSRAFGLACQQWHISKVLVSFCLFNWQPRKDSSLISRFTDGSPQAKSESQKKPRNERPYVVCVSNINHWHWRWQKETATKLTRVEQEWGTVQFLVNAIQK